MHHGHDAPFGRIMSEHEYHAVFGDDQASFNAAARSGNNNWKHRTPVPVGTMPETLHSREKVRPAQLEWLGLKRVAVSKRWSVLRQCRLQVLRPGRRLETLALRPKDVKSFWTTAGLGVDFPRGDGP